MAETNPQQQTAGGQALEATEFESLLKKEFKPKTEEAKSAVEQARPHQWSASESSRDRGRRRGASQPARPYDRHRGRPSGRGERAHVDSELRIQVIEAIEQALGGGAPVAVATVVAPGDPPLAEAGTKLLVRPDGDTLGSLGSAAVDDSLATAAREVFTAFPRLQTQTLYLGRDGSAVARRSLAQPGDAEVMLQLFEAPAKLIVHERSTGEHDHRDPIGEQRLGVVSDRFVRSGLHDDVWTRCDECRCSDDEADSELVRQFPGSGGVAASC